VCYSKTELNIAIVRRKIRRETRRGRELGKRSLPLLLLQHRWLAFIGIPSHPKSKGGGDRKEAGREGGRGTAATLG